MIVKILQGCQSSVHFTYKGIMVNAKSILSLLTLAAVRNSQILIETEGEDAEEIMQRLVAAFESHFEEITKNEESINGSARRT